MRPDDRPPMTNEEGDVRELTIEDFRDARPMREVMPELIEAVEDWRRAQSPGVYIGLMLSADVVASIEALGPGANAEVERILRKAGLEGARLPD
jgi:uncharacterized protein (DUF4415 family)